MHLFLFTRSVAITPVLLECYSSENACALHMIRKAECYFSFL